MQNDYEERAAKIGASIDKAADSGTNVMVAGQGVTEGQLKEAKRMGIEVSLECTNQCFALGSESDFHGGFLHDCNGSISGVGRV